jgi:hypothetical protein
MLSELMENLLGEPITKILIARIWTEAAERRH